MNDISPWRQAGLNQTFPNDKTKVWSETKAAMAVHNVAMGNSHDYSMGDRVSEKFKLPGKK